MRLNYLISATLSPEACQQFQDRVPGIRCRPTSISVPDNAVPIVEKLLTRNHITWKVRRPSGVSLSPYQRMTMTERLLGYQKRVIESAAVRDNVLLKSPTGSGKSLCGLAMATQVAAANGVKPKIVWITLAISKRGHLREVQTWTDLKPQLLYGETPEPIREDTEIVLLNWEILHAWLDTLARWWPTVVVYDELPKAKQPKRFNRIPTEDGQTLRFAHKGNISDVAARLSKLPSVKRRIGMSATFISDRVRDLWSQFDIIFPGEHGKRAQWMTVHAGRHIGDFGQIDDRGASHLDELKMRIDRMAIRVSKEESHAQLPPLRREIVRLSADDLIDISTRRAASENAGLGPTEAALSLSSLRKRKVIKEFVLEATSDSQKVAVVVGRRREAQELADFLRKSVDDDCSVNLAFGEQSTIEREAEARQYITKTGSAVLVMTLQSMGRAFDRLQCTNLVLFAYLPQTPEELIQGEGRFQRLSLTLNSTPCLIKYLVAEGGIDERIKALLLDKLTVMQEVFDEASLKEVREVLGSGKSDAEIQKELLASVIRNRRSEMWQDD